MGGLNGRVALVTGAAGGIGRATSLLLAEAGADVGLVDRDGKVHETSDAVERLGRRAAAEMFDIAEAAAVHDGVERIRQRLGQIDVLVNNAGIVNNIGSITGMPLSAWERELAVNLTGAFNMIREVIVPMAERGWGRIINVSSMAAVGGLHRQAGYAASKAGLLGLTRTVTLEYAGHGVACNAVLPGLIATPNVRAMPPELLEHAIESTPTKRLGEPGEVAALIVFLASDEAGFINGALVPVDGGMGLNVGFVNSRRGLAEMFPYGARGGAGGQSDTEVRG